MERNPCVYMLTNKSHGTLYIGVTSNLPKRVWEHKSKVVKGFSSKYNLSMLIWYEKHESMESAIIREKALKFWKRAWKIRLIEESNPNWNDLYKDVVI